MFANRLRKMARHVSKWARRQGITCYRVYDRDVPGYPLAIDVYDGDIHAQEYQRKVPLDDAEHDAWVAEVTAAMREVWDVRDERIFLKLRRRQKGFDQYQRIGARREERVVVEGGLRFLINLTDYLDTGLFLDHRALRGMVGAQAAGKRFLNLFAYTGSFTVYAAGGGARASTTVDLSQTYLAWAENNLALNGVATGGPHRLVRDDCVRWLAEEAARAPASFDLIVCDPPTFSRSKRMAGILDIQRDHPRLIADAARLLAPDGTLYFSTNFRRFHLDEQALATAADSALDLREITAQTTSEDFRRRPIHRCWRVRHGAG